MNGPWIEGGGMSAAEESKWNQATAYLGVDLNEAFAQAVAEETRCRPPLRPAPSWLSLFLLAVFVILLLIGATA